MRREQKGYRRPAVALTAVILSSIVLGAAPPPRRFVVALHPHTVNTNSVSVTLQVFGEVPEFVAVSVRPKEPELNHELALENFRTTLSTNRNPVFVSRTQMPRPPDNPKWLPFQTNLVVDLRSGEGEREVLFAYKYKGQAHDGSWSGSSITIQRGTPTLRIVNPTNFLSSQPMINLQGLTSRKFHALRFDRFDNAGNKVASGHQGLGTSFFGGYDFKPTDNYFSFVDVDLSPGTNTFAFHGTDEFGNEMTTNIVIVFSIAHDHTPPLIRLDWPTPNEELAGANYTIRGRMDDFTAKLQARIRTKDGSMIHQALVERNGYFWIEDVPLGLDANQITLTATDAAGNSSETNFTVIGREGPIITMDPVNPPDLWKEFVPVTGRVIPPNHDVWINGVQAKVQPDGTWSAERVPVFSPNGGTAVFGMSTHPRSGAPANKSRISEVVSVQGSLGTNAVILNASTPACGLFRLHVSETRARASLSLLRQT